MAMLLSVLLCAILASVRITSEAEWTAAWRSRLPVTPELIFFEITTPSLFSALFPQGIQDKWYVLKLTGLVCIRESC